MAQLIAKLMPFFARRTFEVVATGALRLEFVHLRKKALALAA
jgi:hypothetical protein